MKTIAFLTSDMSDFGGTQTVVSILSNAFNEKFGYKVVIYTMSQKNGIIKYPLNSSIVLINLNIDFNFRNYLKLIKKVNALNWQNHVDVVLGIGCYLSIFLPFLRNVKRIACEHNTFDIVSFLTKHVRNVTYRFVDYVVSITVEDVSKYLRINKNSLTIHNPVIFSESKFPEVRENIVITAGTLTERKGMDRLLKAWKIVEERNSDVKLEIYGEGEENDNLLKLMNELGLKNVSFLGNTQQLSEKLNRSKLYVLPSRKEGFPMVVLEAMNNYLPVVSFDIKTGPNEIITDGEDGYLVKDGDIETFAEKILLLLSDIGLLRELSINAKKNIERFSVDNILKQWEMIL